MRLAVIALAAGAWLLQRQAELPGAVALAALAIAMALPAALARSVPMVQASAAAVLHLRTGALVAAFGLLGFLWAALWAHGRMADRLDPAWEGRELEITGGIAGLP